MFRLIKASQSNKLKFYHISQQSWNPIGGHSSGNEKALNSLDAITQFLQHNKLNPEDYDISKLSSDIGESISGNSIFTVQKICDADKDTLTLSDFDSLEDPEYFRISLRK